MSAVLGWAPQALSGNTRRAAAARHDLGERRPWRRVQAGDTGRGWGLVRGAEGRGASAGFGAPGSLGSSAPGTQAKLERSGQEVRTRRQLVKWGEGSTQGLPGDAQHLHAVREGAGLRSPVSCSRSFSWGLGL